MRTDILYFVFPFSVTLEKGSGVERYSYDLLHNLQNSKYSIRTISKPSGSKIEKYLETITRTPLNTLMTKAKVYHAVSPYSSRFLFAAGKKPVLTSVHDIIYLEWQQESPDFFERRREKYNVMAIRRSDKLIVPFQFTRNKILETFYIDDDKIRVVNYGINLSRYYIKSEDPTQRKYSYDVIFIGGVNPLSRGGETVIKTYAELLNLNPTLKLCFSGKGDQMDSIKKLSIKLGISEKVFWKNFIPEVEFPTFLNSAKVFFYPSKMGFSYLMMQAMATGVPLVTSNVFDIPEFVKDSALTGDPDDYECFTKHILHLLEEQNFRVKKIEDSFRVINNYSPERMAAETFRIYSEYM